ncbi:MAG: type VI secretion system contractile sheath large subunit [Planctomycetota bacterium]|nr:type VI secretion system contractile sheath large subunit [Planctomycetota bacterium]
MSTGSGAAPQSSGAATTVTTTSLLDRVVSQTKQTPRDEAVDLLQQFMEAINAKTISIDKNHIATLERAIEELDERLSKQLATVMHHPQFQKLEGSWRGLHYLVDKTETSTSLKIRMLNVSKKELKNDLQQAIEFDQSETWKRIFEEEYGTPGGNPFGAMVGDYEFENTNDDIDTLSRMSKISAACFAPFITSPSPKLFGFDNWTDLKNPRDIAKIFDSKAYIKWNAFRATDESRFVVMSMPRVLARLPYGTAKPIDEFDFQEVALGPNRSPISVPHDQYCWMNAAYVMGTRLTDAFARTGFCTAIRGAEGGGRVSDLPTYVFSTDDGDLDAKCPTEIAITGRREKELSDTGFLPICHYKNTDYAVFFGAQTTQKPVKYDRPEATANAQICARLPYIMAVSRFSHFLQVMGRNKVGSFLEASETEKLLDRWINNYVSTNNPDADTKARLPLAAAQVKVEEIPGKPGSYHAVLHMRPWLQMEELTASMRLVARIPQNKS